MTDDLKKADLEMLSRIGKREMMLRVQIDAAGGRAPNRLKRLILAGLVETFDHPTVKDVGRRYPAEAVRLTEAGRLALVPAVKVAPVVTGEEMNLTDEERDHVVAARERPDGMVAASRVIEMARTISSLRTQLSEATGKLDEIERARAAQQAEYDRVVAICDNPPAPSPALVALMQKYRPPGS